MAKSLKEFMQIMQNYANYMRPLGKVYKEQWNDIDCFCSLVKKILKNQKRTQMKKTSHFFDFSKVRYFFFFV